MSLAVAVFPKLPFHETPSKDILIYYVVGAHRQINIEMVVEYAFY